MGTKKGRGSEIRQIREKTFKTNLWFIYDSQTEE